MQALLTKKGGKAQDLLDALTNEPKKSYVLEHDLGVSGGEIRVIVKALRRKGYPICSGTNGYWIGDKQDIDHTIAHLRSRIADMSETVNAMEAMQLNGQLEVLI